MATALEMILARTKPGIAASKLKRIIEVSQKLPSGRLSSIPVTRAIEPRIWEKKKEAAEIPRFYPFGILPGGVVATGGAAGVPPQLGYVRETGPGVFKGGMLPADVGRALPTEIPIQPGDITNVTYEGGEMIIPDIPGVTHFAEREVIREQIEWHERIIEIPGITLPEFEFPDLLGGLKDLGKYALIGIAAIVGIVILTKVGGKK